MNKELIAKLEVPAPGRTLGPLGRVSQAGRRSDASPTRDLLTHVVEEEYRHQTRECPRNSGANAPASPNLWVIETFPFERQPKLNKKKIMALYDSLGYLTKTRTSSGWAPPAAARPAWPPAFSSTPSTRAIAVATCSLPTSSPSSTVRSPITPKTRSSKNISPSTCLQIDEIGYVEVEPAQVGLFFTLMHQRHKKKPTLITSNLGFAEWGSFLKNDHLTAALIDRLTENSHVINMKECVSLRPKISPEP